MLKVKNIRKEFRRGDFAQRAVEDVSFEVKPGEFILLSGRSGSGKTTLLNLIGGLEVPDRGEVHFNQQNLATLDDASVSKIRRKEIGFIFQTFNLVPVLSAFENVEYALIMLGIEKEERQERVREILKRVGLSDHHGSKPSQLSGGQRQRVAIARALVKRPSLILADEPTANLDSKTADEVVALIQELFTGSRASVIFCTHDSNMLRHGTRSIEMSDGLVSRDRRQT